MVDPKEQAHAGLRAASSKMLPLERARAVRAIDVDPEARIEVGIHLGFAAVSALLAIAEAIEHLATTVAKTHTDSIDARKDDT